MTDRPIIFSAPMVRALLAGRKTQTRRLATSPLRRVEAGDRLYVREHWRVSSAQDRVAPRDLLRELTVEFVADGVGYFDGKHRQGMHMPRWASRLTLVVEGVKVEPLQSISAEDARDEGVDRRSQKVRQFWLFGADAEARERIYLQACPWEYEDLWNSLHTADGQRWEDNPDVVALTFRVVRANIDCASPTPSPTSEIARLGGDGA